MWVNIRIQPHGKTHSHQNPSTFQPCCYSPPTDSLDPLHYRPLLSPVQLCNACDMRDLEGIYLQLKHALSSFCSEVMMVWLHPRWPYYKEGAQPWERGIEGAEEKNGSAAFSSAGSPSGRHKSSDVTNAVNVLACLQYGLLERAKPVGALLPVSSPTHFKTHPETQFKLLSHLVSPPHLRLIERVWRSAQSGHMRANPERIDE